MKILFLVALFGCIELVEPLQYGWSIKANKFWLVSLCSEDCSTFNSVPAIEPNEQAASGIQFHTSFSMLLLSAIALAIALIRERRHKHRLQELIHIDHLTSLYNRRYLYRLGKRLLSRSNSGASSFAAIMLDVDHFKQVNDAYGHATGDKVLTEIARVCIGECRPSDIVGRFGGEEFLLLLPDTRLGEALAVAERIRLKINHIEIDSSHQHIKSKGISASLGVSCSNQEVCLDFDELIKFADEAMYRAKAAGRNRVQS
ncbi:MAG: GGDEF domain-containing protein [Cellvibrionaceae bacterium]|nr:GGDEF domain-containing protein [Cellvibrionaceae bacterium]